MADSYTKVTHQSWGSRLKGTLGGVVIGFILFIAAFPLLFWNEGNSIRRAQALEEGKRIVVSIDAIHVLEENDNQLVHLIGEAMTIQDALEDVELDLKVAMAIKLRRMVEMYQWEEHQESTTKEKWGGGTETVTTYTHSETWSESLIDSNNFEYAENYRNPAEMPLENKTFVAQQITLGEFTISKGFVDKINKYQYLPMDDKMRKQTLEKLNSQYGTTHFSGEYYYISEKPSHPQIGDIRIKYQVVWPTTISVIARQFGTQLTTYMTSMDEPLELFEYGEVTAPEMFANAKFANITQTWILRFVGFLMMFIGLLFILNVLAILAAVIPIFGRIIGAASAIISLIMAAVLTIITIAIAWLLYRPILSIILFVIAGTLLYFLKFVRQQPTVVPLETSEPTNSSLNRSRQLKFNEESALILEAVVPRK